MLLYVFYTCCTIVKTSIGATPYSLVHGIEVVMLLEVEILSLKVMWDSELEKYEWANIRYEQLNMISEKRLAMICHHQLYQKNDGQSIT
jgi:hypothetical protein